jgi:hypothetical protein
VRRAGPIVAPDTGPRGDGLCADATVIVRIDATVSSLTAAARSPMIHATYGPERFIWLVAGSGREPAWPPFRSWKGNREAHEFIALIPRPHRP